MEIRKIAILGLGAIGCTVAPGLSRVVGKDNFCVIASGERRKRLEEKGMTINGQLYHFRVSDVEEQEEEDLIIVAVKAGQLQQAARDIRNHVGNHTMIMSLMNGVTSEAYFGELYGREKVVYSLTTISSQIKAGAAFYSLEAGEIKFGEAQNYVLSERIGELDRLFTKAGIPHIIPENMELALWQKFLFNVSNNSVAAILHARHFYFQHIDAANEARRIVLLEARKVAEAKGIPVTDETIESLMFYSEEYPADGYCSMVQDIEAGRRTEKEIFLGDLIRMAEETGVDVPVCRFLYQVLEAMECAAECGRKEHIC